MIAWKVRFLAPALVFVGGACIHAERGSLDGTQPLGMLLTSVLAETAGAADAAGPVPPPKVFVTTATTQGTIGGIAAADAFCQGDSNKPGSPPGATYRALLVDGAGRYACLTPNCGGGAAENLNWVLRPNIRYVRSDDLDLLTTNAAGIFVFGNMDNPWSSTSVSDVWTGLQADWTSSPDSCSGWSSTATNGARGNSNAFTTAIAINSGALASCVIFLRLICVQQ